MNIQVSSMQVYSLTYFCRDSLIHLKVNMKEEGMANCDKIAGEVVHCALDPQTIYPLELFCFIYIKHWPSLRKKGTKQ